VLIGYVTQKATPLPTVTRLAIIFN